MTSANTAIHRTKPSAPLTRLLPELEGRRSPILKKHHFRILDYGCGHGKDVEHLRSLGYNAYGWDPYHGDTTIRLPVWKWDVILCTYVLNVIPEDLRQVLYKRLLPFSDS